MTPDVYIDPSEIRAKFTSAAAQKAFDSLNALQPLWRAYETAQGCKVMAAIRVVDRDTQENIGVTQVRFDPWDAAVLYQKEKIFNEAATPNAIVIVNPHDAETRKYYTLSQRTKTFVTAYL